ncbi:MAG: DNA polymerase III subunit beta [Clostridiales bacterium]|jgi:DNA polymerase-3 subunit beta|nr:DNA polymerase III subunit beta [Clostridiales bacterium]
MKFSCEKAILLTAVNAAARTVARSSSIVGLEGILVEADRDTVTFTGYNLTTGVRAVINTTPEKSGAVVINARLLGEIIRKSPDDYITFDADENMNVKITCGPSEFSIMGLSAGDYPDLPAPEKEKSLNLPADTLRNMISMTVFAVSDNESKPVHTGSLFDIKDGSLNIVAVDGYRMAIRREPVTSTVPEMSFVVPGPALREVERLCGDSDEDVVINLGRRHITFEIGDVTLISRLLEGDFINYEASIPKDMPVSVIADTHALQTAVDRVSLIINERLKNPVRCNFEEGVLRLNCVTPLGRANDEIAIEGDGGDIEIGFNNRYLSDAIKAVPDEKVSISLINAISPCILKPIEDDKYLFMVLPVRLKV